MPSDRRVIAYRPSEEEEDLIQALARKHGLPLTRVLGMALRRFAEAEGVKVSTTPPAAPEGVTT